MSDTLRFGPFLLDSRIAVGGTAEVYLARPATSDPRYPDKLVVKRLLPHFANDPEGRTMFDREAQLHAAVTHENVVTVFGAGHDEYGEPYLAMEYIEGVDGYRLLRRLRQEDEVLPVGVCIYVAREVLRALESVHAARDPSGGSLGIVHRDVSPSNIYLSKDGKVKLGDFGIARSTTRTTLRSEAGHVLKGKFGYLAPEQVAGEGADHRADLFSLGTVLAEMLLNRPLFPGGGQLAVLLAIRDCKIDALSEIEERLPPGLFEVMQKALSRSPGDRYATATEFANALAPFEAAPRYAVQEISVRVRWVQSTPSTDKLAAVRESVRQMRAVKDAAAEGAAAEGAAVQGGSAQPRAQPSAQPRAQPSAQPRAEPSAQPRAEPSAQPRAQLESEAPSAPPPTTKKRPDPEPPEWDTGEDRKTEEYESLPSFVRKTTGELEGPWAFARLMEALATGQISRGDQIDFVGRGFRAVEDVEEFVRFLPSITATTGKMRGPGAPDYAEQLGVGTLLQTLTRVMTERETGVLFAERTDGGGEGRKELYFVGGKLHHVVSSNASELLGEYLVRRGRLDRAELDLALAVLPRYGGRMGDTLISMGLCGPVDIFRAIREQGRDRVADLFLWKGGAVSFYRGQTAPHVEFPLDLPLAPLILAGLEAAKPGDVPVEERRADFARVLGPAASADPLGLAGIELPAVVSRVLMLTKQPVTLRDLLKAAARGGDLAAGDTLRALDLLLAAGLVAFHS